MCPAAQMAQKQKSRTIKSPLMQDWVLRMRNYLSFSLWKVYISVAKSRSFVPRKQANALAFHMRALSSFARLLKEMA